MFSMWKKKQKQMEVSYAATKGCVFCKWKHKNALLVVCLHRQCMAAFHSFILLALQGIASFEKRMGGISDTNCLPLINVSMRKPHQAAETNTEWCRLFVLMEIQRGKKKSYLRPKKTKCNRSWEMMVRVLQLCPSPLRSHMSMVFQPKYVQCCT